MRRQQNEKAPGGRWMPHTGAELSRFQGAIHHPTQFDAIVNDKSCFQVVTRHHLEFAPALWHVGNKSLDFAGKLGAALDQADHSEGRSWTRACTLPVSRSMPADLESVVIALDVAGSATALMRTMVILFTV
jgi:hypothetical protein